MKRLQMGGPKKIFPLLLIIILFAGISATAGYFYWQYKQLASKDSDAEVASLVKDISQLMMLPDTAPTVATVSDKEKLKDQPVFKNAENGDKLLIYLETQKAILYRPSVKKIVDVIPIRTSGTVAGENTEAQTQDNTEETPTTEASPNP